jgi:formate dehydrogenase subunit gamma
MRAVLFALLLLIAATVVVPTATVAQTLAQASAPQANPHVPVDPDGSAVQEQALLQDAARIQGRIDIPDTRASVLIQPEGRKWDYFHEITLHWGGAILLSGTLVLLALGYLVLGRLRFSGRSGRKIVRFTPVERFAHWLTAVSFVLLGLTGLNITFGKLVLLPIITPESFSAFAQIAKYTHNFVSFAFVIGLAMIVTFWLKDNIPNKVDVQWIKQGGGFIKGKHAHAERFNAGEKVVFWSALFGGIAVIGSGYFLLFPFYWTNIAGMQLAQIVHAIVAVLFIALILGHIYIGTLGTEGAFEAMGTGEVDVNWAKEHHDLWLQKKLAEGGANPPATSRSPAPAD